MLKQHLLDVVEVFEVFRRSKAQQAVLQELQIRRQDSELGFLAALLTALGSPTAWSVRAPAQQASFDLLKQAASRGLSR